MGRGFWGTVCHVDLSTGKIERESLDSEVYERFLGGIGLGAKILWDRLKPGADPMGPDNILGFAPGLLTDTGSYFTGRFCVMGKSPASGGWGDANCGGFFSPFLKKCGVDALFFHGSSERPVYLCIDHESAKLLDASDLWGRDTVETEIELKQRHGRGAQVACIGPSGEKRSFISGVCNDGGRIAARSGLGGVMGAKNLKAVAAKGKKRIPVADKPLIKTISAKFKKDIEDWRIPAGFMGDKMLALHGWIMSRGLFKRQHPFLWRWLLRQFGTPCLTSGLAQAGDSPMKNWGGAVDPDFPFPRYSKLGLEPVLARQVKKYGCYSCPVRCGGHVTVTEGPYRIEEMHKPEYETICAFGALILNDDLDAVFKINDMVNRAGIDSISCGAVVAFAIECFENGVITKTDTDGLELTWGNARAVVELTSRIIKREGLGDILADGVKPAAEKIGGGSQQFAVHCGGVELPMHDPRFDTGWAYTYYCEPTPGRHTVACNQFADLQEVRKKFKRLGESPPGGDNPYLKEAHEMAVVSFYKMLIDCTGACLFGTQVGGDFPLCQWMNAATGWELSNEEYLSIGERVKQLRHAFNLREGINVLRDQRPNPRIYGSPPLRSGPHKNVTLDMDAMAQAYLMANRWDTLTGMPERDYLQQLSLPEVVQELFPKTDKDSR